MRFSLRGSAESKWEEAKEMAEHIKAEGGLGKEKAGDLFG